MKELNSKTKKQINAYIDNELDIDDKYKIERLIENHEQAKDFYTKMYLLEHN